MEYETFAGEIKRLQDVYGKNSYPQERQKVLWRTFQKLPDSVFVDAVEFLIVSHRSTPLVKEFHDAVNEGWERKKREEYEYSRSRDMVSILKDAYNPALYSDSNVRERIKGRIKLLTDYTSGKIKRPAFEQGLNFYDEAAGLK